MLLATVYSAVYILWCMMCLVNKTAAAAASSGPVASTSGEKVRQYLHIFQTLINLTHLLVFWCKQDFMYVYMHL